MDLVEWLLGDATVLDGTVIVRLLLLVIIIHLFGICTYWTSRFK